MLLSELKTLCSERHPTNSAQPLPSALRETPHQLHAAPPSGVGLSESTEALGEGQEKCPSLFLFPSH